MKTIQNNDLTESSILACWPRAGTADVTFGSQLVVEEGREAIVFREGVALDLFGPGRHELVPAGLPSTIRALGPEHDPSTPFRATVVFVSKRPCLGFTWGTREPIVYDDSELAKVSIRAYGRFAVRVGDPRRFVESVVGSLDIRTTEALEAHLRDVIVTGLADLLAERLDSIFDLPRVHAELAEGLGERVAGELSGSGLELVDICIAGFTPPREVHRLVVGRVGASAVEEMNAALERASIRIEAASVGPDEGGGESPTANRQPTVPCAHCGEGLPAGARFCSACGGEVTG